MPRATGFVRWIVLALVVGLVALHLPLDALRLHAPAALAKAPVKSCASCCAPAAPAASADDADDADCPALDAPAPAPQDGCDPGCHCGCCGGVPIVGDVRRAPLVEPAGGPSRSRHLAAAPRARRLEIFHPPRA